MGSLCLDTKRHDKQGSVSCTSGKQRNSFVLCVDDQYWRHAVHMNFKTVKGRDSFFNGLNAQKTLVGESCKAKKSVDLVRRTNAIQVAKSTFT